MSEEMELPEGWIETTLGEIRVDLARSIEPNKTPEKLFELYSVPSFESHKPEIIFGSSIGSNKQSVEMDTVLLCKINPRINRAWVVGNYSDYPKIASTEWIPFFKLEGVNPIYLCYYMSLKSFRDYLAANASGVGGSLMRINERTFVNYPFPLAPLPEQHRIVAAIEQRFTILDAVETALKQCREKLKRARSAVLKYAVEGKLTEAWRAKHPASETGAELLKRILDERRKKWEEEQLAKMQAKGMVPKDDKWKKDYKEPVSPDTTNLPELPEGWCWATIEQIASPEPRSIQSGPFGSALLHSEFQESGILAIGIDNVLDGRFSMGRQHRISVEKYEKLKKFTARPLDVLVTVMATVGRCCVVPPDLETAIITKHVYRISVNQIIILPHFLMLCLSGGSEVQRQLFGQVQGVTRPGINGEILRRVAISLPSLAEQQQIVTEVERRLSVIEQAEAVVEANLKRVERARQSILKKAFAGKLVPQDPNDEPASVLLERIREERRKREEDELQRRKDGKMNNTNDTKRKRTPKKGERSLYQVLVEAQQPLTPDATFKQAGLQPDVAEDVNDFFDEVHCEVDEERIEELRPDDTQVLLKAASDEA